MDRRFPLLLLCFFLSGLAALVYEISWTREFAFVFGTSELAVATVLAAYMGGLALGSALAGRFAPRIRRPVLAYGLLELGIALGALAVPLGVQASRWLYVAVFGGREVLPEAAGLPTALFYLVCSFAILLVPTAMMGATLPLLARHAVRRVGEIGSRIGVLYATNTAGAVAGAVLGAFVLLPSLGLRDTILVAAAINASVFAAAWALSRAPAPTIAAEEDPPPSDDGSETTGAHAWILPLLTVSGFVSFTYEVLWVRLLGHVVGSSVHAFATMLASFLLGIALGAAVASRLAATPRRAAGGFAIAQLGIAALSVAAFAGLDRLPGLSDQIQLRGFDKLWAHACLSVATLLPAAVCIGATFPFAVRLLAQRSSDAGPASARAYSWNTVGSILGSIAAAFLLVPGLGIEGTLLFCAAHNLALAAAAALLFEPRRKAVLAAAAAGAAALAFLPPSTPWALLRASSLGSGAPSRAWGRVAYFGIGRSSTVLVVDQHLHFALRTNGLPESSMPERDSWHNASPVTRWLTALPVFARPDTRDMLVIGFGGGMLLEVVPGSVERIDVVELEPEVIEANRSIADRRWRDPLSDPRVHVHVNDARNALLLADRRFDAIVSQPSHPWAGGAAHLYTSEFFQLVKQHLSDDGVFLQWIGLPFVDEALFRSLLATLASTFDYVQAYEPPPGGSVLFLASNAPLDPLPNATRAIERNPEDMMLLGIIAPEDVSASLILDDAGVREIADDAPLNRDGHNRLQDRSARLGDSVLSFPGRLDELVGPVDPLVHRPPEAADRFYLLRHLRPPSRAARFAASFADPVDRLVGEAIAEAAEGKRVSPRRKLEEALAQDPHHGDARAALLRLSTHAILEGRDPETIVAPPLGETEQTLVSAWRAREADPGGEALLALDDALAAVPPRHALAPEAALLRAIGRLQTRDPERIREAVAIVESSLGDEPDANSLLLRAEVFSAAGEYGTMLETLTALSWHIPLDVPKPARAALALRARDLVLAVPTDDPDIALLRFQVLRLYGVDPRRA